MPSCGDPRCCRQTLPLNGTHYCAVCDVELHDICGSFYQDDIKYKNICYRCETARACSNGSKHPAAEQLMKQPAKVSKQQTSNIASTCHTPLLATKVSKQQTSSSVATRFSSRLAAKMLKQQTISSAITHHNSSIAAVAAANHSVLKPSQLASEVSSSEEESHSVLKPSRLASEVSSSEEESHSALKPSRLANEASPSEEETYPVLRPTQLSSPSEENKPYDEKNSNTFDSNKIIDADGNDDVIKQFFEEFEMQQTIEEYLREAEPGQGEAVNNQKKKGSLDIENASFRSTTNELDKDETLLDEELLSSKEEDEYLDETELLNKIDEDKDGYLPAETRNRLGVENAITRGKIPSEEKQCNMRSESTISETNTSNDFNSSCLDVGNVFLRPGDIIEYAPCRECHIDKRTSAYATVTEIMYGDDDDSDGDDRIEVKLDDFTTLYDMSMLRRVGCMNNKGKVEPSASEWKMVNEFSLGKQCLFPKFKPVKKIRVLGAPIADAISSLKHKMMDFAQNEGIPTDVFYEKGTKSLQASK